MKEIKQKVYKYRINKNLIFKGIETMNDGELEIYVNDKPLGYVDLDSFGFDYTSSLTKKFKEICDLIIFDLYNGDELGFMDYCREPGLREIKENY